MRSEPFMPFSPTTPKINVGGAVALSEGVPPFRSEDLEQDAQFTRVFMAKGPTDTSANAV
jgi:hypothetical protein